MTNKESIQAAHLDIIKYKRYDGDENAATSCTTITAERMGEAMEWIVKEAFKLNAYSGKYYIIGEADEFTLEELKELFLNQKAKI